MGDEAAEAPPVRRDGVGWISVSAVLLPVGWFSWLFVETVGDFGPGSTRPSLATRTISDAVITLVCVGTPVVGAILLSLRRRRDRSTTLVGPTVCIVIAAMGLFSVGYSTLTVAQDWASDVRERAQPPTALETSRTPARAAADLRAVGERAVRASGAVPRDDDVTTSTRGCSTSNRDLGTSYLWSGSSAKDVADRLPREEIESRTAAARAVLERAGLGDDEPWTDGVRLNGDGWLRTGIVTATAVDRSVFLETACFEGGPGQK